MKKIVVTAALGALAVLPAAPAGAADCLQGGTHLDVYLLDRDRPVVAVPLYQVDVHCLDHLIPPY